MPGRCRVRIRRSHRQNALACRYAPVASRAIRTAATALMWASSGSPGLLARYSRPQAARPARVTPSQAGPSLSLAACGREYRGGKPGLPQLAHIRAVAAVRIALEATGAYRQASAFWRCERRIRTRHRPGMRQHLPDGEVHWPDEAPVAWAGECWAVEAELTPKTVARTTAIMREILARTGDYGCPAAEATAPGQPFRHARALYLCSPAALATVLRSRAELGPLGARVELRDLPPAALLSTLRSPRNPG